MKSGAVGRRNILGHLMKRVVTQEELRTPLVPYERAVELVMSDVEPLSPVDVAVGDALGLVAAAEVTADVDVPGFASSAMDGYAVRATDTAGASADRPAELNLIDDLPAGAVPSVSVVAGTAAKIMTGGPVPPGADAVVPWEDTEQRGDGVAVLREFSHGRNVRPRGEDVRKGDRVIEPGTVLRAVHLGVLSSFGRTHVRVHPRPRVALLSTGDELVDPGRPLGAGQVYDTNRTLLSALCQAAGARVTAAGLVVDDPGSVTAWLSDHSGEADLLVTSGGASVGEHDWLRDVLSREGQLSMWRVAMKPGKPIAYARFAGTRVLALPGNPGSVFACAHAFVAPVLRRLAGRDPSPPARRARLAEDVKGSPSRTLLCRVRLDGDQAVPLPAQSSVVLSNLIPTQGFAIVPPGGLPAGADVRVELID
jgi:molybdopterin molybdotransferase